MIFSFIAILVISNYLRNSFKSTVHFREWNSRFLFLIIASVALFTLSYAAKATAVWCEALICLLLWAVLAVLFKNPVFRSYRFILVAVVPLAIIYTLSFVMKHTAPLFFKGVIAVLDKADDFAALWMIGFLFFTNRQRKELEKSRKKVEEAQKNSAFLAGMRDELEVQVQQRTAELTRQKEELELALGELKTTQTQLIQSEKMASLGELTAGIAHEIQNPLNFVNNFSDVNTELIEEMEAEIAKGDMEEAVAIAKDIKDNNQKIAHHGRRADSIVKGMLQHSRASNGQKEPTDINALADEYLRLSYHGLRAKDKSFNASFKIAFDDSVGKIDVQPQDLGRVFLNLFNNAFYAVSEKKKRLNGAYEPTVYVSTKKLNDEVEVIVKDNGTGIPQSLVDKIFQPFFTTKPTGEGTGLGLSLSYDIITKGHGGELKVETKENEGTIFTIVLPCSQL